MGNEAPTTGWTIPIASVPTIPFDCFIVYPQNSSVHNDSSPSGVYRDTHILVECSHEIDQEAFPTDPMIRVFPAADNDENASFQYIIKRNGLSKYVYVSNTIPGFFQMILNTDVAGDEADCLLPGMEYEIVLFGNTFTSRQTGEVFADELRATFTTHDGPNSHCKDSTNRLDGGTVGANGNFYSKAKIDAQDCETLVANKIAADNYHLPQDVCAIAPTASSFTSMNTRPGEPSVIGISPLPGMTGVHPDEVYVTYTFNESVVLVNSANVSNNTFNEFTLSSVKFEELSSASTMALQAFEAGVPQVFHLKRRGNASVPWDVVHTFQAGVDIFVQTSKNKLVFKLPQLEYSREYTINGSVGALMDTDWDGTHSYAAHDAWTGQVKAAFEGHYFRTIADVAMPTEKPRVVGFGVRAEDQKQLFDSGPRGAESPVLTGQAIHGNNIQTVRELRKPGRHGRTRAPSPQLKPRCCPWAFQELEVFFSTPLWNLNGADVGSGITIQSVQNRSDRQEGSELRRP